MKLLIYHFLLYGYSSQVTVSFIVIIANKETQSNAFRCDIYSTTFFVHLLPYSIWSSTITNVPPSISFLKVFTQLQRLANSKNAKKVHFDLMSSDSAIDSVSRRSDKNSTSVRVLLIFVFFYPRNTILIFQSSSKRSFHNLKS